MKSTNRMRFPKKLKSKQHQKPQLITQDDYYLEAINYEEQAERWLLSDIKKTLRFYLKAYELYEIGLATTAVEHTDKCTYNILYNETRLLLQLYSDYMANSGYINILQYVDLNDIIGVETILRPLPEIINRFEIVLNKYDNIADTWDLQSNLIISYLSLLENYDKFELTGDQIITLTQQFSMLSHKLIIYQMGEIEKNLKMNDDDTAQNEGETLINDNLANGKQTNSGVGMDGSGIQTNKKNNDPNQGEMMEVSDEVTPETLTELLVNCFKFNQCLLEIITENKFDSENNMSLLNPVQSNYLEDFVNKQLSSLDDIVMSQQNNISLKLNDIHIVTYSVNGIKLILSNSEEQVLQDHLSTQYPEDTFGIDPIDFNLVKIDLLQLAINCVSDDSLDTKWKLCTQLNQLLTNTRTRLTAARQTCLTSHDQTMIAKLSSVVFQLCDVTITASSNELQRYEIKQLQTSSTASSSSSQERDASIKVQNILLKNARTLLANAQTIAEKSCGMQETIVDKLKRNYIYNEAKNRLNHPLLS